MSARRWRWRASGPLLYGGVALAACLEAVLVLRLWRANLRVPFSYSGDSLFFAVMVKTAVDHGWYLTNPRLGAPGVLTLHDFPQADGLHLLVFKALSWLSADWAVLLNIYFLLGFPLIALSAFAVLRHFRVAAWPALVTSLLYAFLPSRLLDGQSHLFLTAFFQVPLAILLGLWVAGDDPPLLAPGRGAWRPAVDLRRRGSVAALAIALVVAGTGVYYAFFAGALILIAGGWSAVARRSPRHALAAIALVAVVVAGLAAQGIPVLLYRHTMGPNPELSGRTVREAEMYGLRIAPLLLPVKGHRIPALAAIKARYERDGLTTGEASSATLGVVGAVGFLLLLATLFARAPAAPSALPSDDRQALRASLARLNLAALLLATTGGFGALFALLVSSSIRTYARMHVFIAFLAFFCVALLLDRLYRSRRRAGVLVAAAVAVVGLSDQVTAHMVPQYAQRAREYRADAAFIHSLEAGLPVGAQIFQLPYLPFPESGGLPETRLRDYDPLRPYLHSRSLRWSYGAIVGRGADAWTSAVADEPARDMVRTLVDAGFAGVLVDRYGYRDDGAALIGALTDALGRDAATPTMGRFVFVTLAAEHARAAVELTDEQRERRRREALDRPVLRWLGGFFAPEHEGGITFRWCSGDCTLEITNLSGHDTRVSLAMQIAAGRPPASLRVTGDLWDDTVALPPGGAAISRMMTVPAGRHPIHLRCDGALALSPRDPRQLVFRIDDAQLRVIDAAQ